MYKLFRFSVGTLLLVSMAFSPLNLAVALTPMPAIAQSVFNEANDAAKNNLRARPPFHIFANNPDSTLAPTGLSPAKVKAAYHLPATGGSGTIAIVDAFDDPNAASDLSVFSSTFGLPAANFEKHKMATVVSTDAGWAVEESLDIQWAHAIAPTAKILLVEAKSDYGDDLLSAVKYAAARSDVVAVSMSWGAPEFNTEANYDAYFTSKYSLVTFFASSGDSGTEVDWPAVSTNVVGVGGTRLNFNTDGSLLSETAWSGSGGGLSRYESEPGYQITYRVPGANGKRAVPDVSYNADPHSGVSVYDSFGYAGQRGWFVIGGTSAGAPQWAAVKALVGWSSAARNSSFYRDAATSNYSTFFRDITIGTNGTCGFYCSAVANYDYVTGLGSPLTKTF